MCLLSIIYDHHCFFQVIKDVFELILSLDNWVGLFEILIIGWLVEVNENWHINDESKIHSYVILEPAKLPSFLHEAIKWTRGTYNNL